MVILIGVTGAILAVWALTILRDQMGLHQRFVFDYQDGVLEFDIETPGAYSIAVWRAGSVSNLTQVAIELQTLNDRPLKIKRYIISPRAVVDGETVTGCWYFITESIGQHKLSLSNLAATKAKKSMSPLKREFENDIEKNRLRIFIHKSVLPLYQILAPLALVIGLNMVMLSFFIDL